MTTAPKTIAHIALKSIDSTGIHACGYDPAGQNLHVQFKPAGPVYVYREVSVDQHRELQEADSCMGYLRENIMGVHGFVKLAPPQQDEQP